MRQVVRFCFISVSFFVFHLLISSVLRAGPQWSRGYDSCFGCRRSRVRTPAGAVSLNLISKLRIFLTFRNVIVLFLKRTFQKELLNFVVFRDFHARRDKSSINQTLILSSLRALSPNSCPRGLPEKPSCRRVLSTFRPLLK